MALLLNPQGLPKAYVHLLPISCEDGGGHPWFKEEAVPKEGRYYREYLLSGLLLLHLLGKQSLVVGMGQTETIKGSKTFRP